jgi:hypothetical protein
MIRTAGLVMVSLLSLKSCTISFGNPQGTGGSSFKLGVPFLAQQGQFNCGPASIQMWAWFNGNRSVTQTQIANYVGCSPTSGTSTEAIVRGTQYFATSDAYADYPGGVNFGRDQFDAQQITSANNRVPLIAIVNGGLHAGVVDGGQWHQAGSTNVWDFVFFHDPLVGADQQYVAGDWDALVIGHIISRSAASGSSANFSTYGPNTVRRGAGAGIGGHGPLPV